MMEGELERASALMNTAEELFSRVGEIWGSAMVRCRQSVIARLRADYAGARALGQQGLEMFENVGDRFGIGHALLTLGQAELAGREPRRAMEQFVAMIASMDEIGNSWFVARGLFCLGPPLACALTMMFQQLCSGARTTCERVSAPGLPAGHERLRTNLRRARQQAGRGRIPEGVRRRALHQARGNDATTYRTQRHRGCSATTAAVSRLRPVVPNGFTLAR
jgi:hypothetical protein